MPTTAPDGKFGRPIEQKIPGLRRYGTTETLSHDGPVLIDAVVNRRQLAMTPAVTVETGKGFTHFAVKAVMRGRGDELIDLACSNLWL